MKNPDRIITETARLILRLPTSSDVASTLAIYSDPQVMEYIDSDRPFEKIDEAARSIERGLAHFEKHGVCYSAVIEKATGRHVGYCGFNVFEDGPDLELVFHFHRACWGRGYATEAARACIEYAFGALDAHRVVALTDPRNAASIRVLEKLGFTFIRDLIESGQLLRLFELTH